MKLVFDLHSGRNHDRSPHIALILSNGGGRGHLSRKTLTVFDCLCSWMQYDATDRLVAAELSERLGMQFVTENKAGSGGTLAA